MCLHLYSIYPICQPRQACQERVYLLHVLKYYIRAEAAVDVIGNIKVQHLTVRGGGFICYIEPTKPCPYALLDSKCDHVVSAQFVALGCFALLSFNDNESKHALASE